ncbi:MAG: hypothetical protein K0Q59_3736 [Paenibacillus sp.]|nr:hypothetical protein [Paenibacillus sp.]
MEYCVCKSQRRVIINGYNTSPSRASRATGTARTAGATGTARTTGTTRTAGTARTAGTDSFLGLGTSQGGAKGFVRDTVVVPFTATITGLVFSIRDQPLDENDTVTAEIYRSTNCGVTPTATGIRVTITGPNPPNCCGFASGSLQVFQCDLLSVRVLSSRALSDGAAATIILQI